MNYKLALNSSFGVSSGVPLQSSNPLRQSKTSVIVFTSLCARAAIEGGLSPEQAYSLGDSYIQSIESAKTISEISAISNAGSLPAPPLQNTAASIRRGSPFTSSGEAPTSPLILFRAVTPFLRPPSFRAPGSVPLPSFRWSAGRTSWRLSCKPSRLWAYPAS